MDWIESIKEINKANNENRLVVFVGSGVSKNSNVPDWNELIITIAKSIDYHEKCKKCDSKIEDCPREDCEKQFNFSREEYLRIPEYYFQSVDDKEKKEYYQTIIDAIRCDAKSNAIDDLIFEILPQHIITTNYDTLLEDSDTINTSMYKVIYKDKDLLSNISDRYLIKMHGDINDPPSIILKESDYIDYEQTHTLISTFIKSLLINFTFLFLGYSLNDNNLNLIIGWINYYCKLYGVDQRPYSFLIQNNAASRFEQLRLVRNNIHVIYTAEIPEDIPCPDSITDNTGKKLFRYLKCISDPTIFSKHIPLCELLKERYEPLNSYKKIAQSDLLSSYNLGKYQRLENELFFWDQKEYQSLASVLSKENTVILSAFNKAHITRIHFQGDFKQKSQTYDIPQCLSTPLFDSYFHMYLNNKYDELSEAIESMAISSKIYYSKLLNLNCNIDALIDVEAREIPKNDFISGLIYRVRARLATLSFDRRVQLTKEINMIIDRTNPYYKNAIGFIKHLNNSTAEDEKKMNELLEKQRARFSENNTWYYDNSFEKIWELQSLVYDYYEFFIINLIPINYYSDPVNYFSSYVESILCSYSPIKEQSDTFLGQTDRRPYPINDIDLDILIKYTETKSLKKAIKRYRAKEILLDKVNIVSKFANFCESSKKIIWPNWSRMFSNFAIILSLCKLETNQIEKIYSAFSSFLIERGIDIPTYIQEANYALKIIVEQCANKGYDALDSKVLHALLSDNIRKVFLERNKGTYGKLLSIFKPNISPFDQENLIKEIGNEKEIKKKCELLYLYRCLIPIHEYSDFLSNNIAEIPAQLLFNFIIENTIPFDPSISEILANNVKRLAENKKTGCISYPDYLAWTIEICILLHLCKFPIDLTKIAFAKQYSEFLLFVTAPQSYDYSKVDLDNYMWQNLIYSDEYQHYFIEHKDTLISEKLKSRIANGLASNDTLKIVYGLLIDKQELRKY